MFGALAEFERELIGVSPPPAKDSSKVEIDASIDLAREIRSQLD